MQENPMTLEEAKKMCIGKIRCLDEMYGPLQTKEQQFCSLFLDFIENTLEGNLISKPRLLDHFDQKYDNRFSLLDDEKRAEAFLDGFEQAQRIVEEEGSPVKYVISPKNSSREETKQEKPKKKATIDDLKDTLVWNQRHGHFVDEGHVVVGNREIDDYPVKGYAVYNKDYRFEGILSQDRAILWWVKEDTLEIIQDLKEEKEEESQEEKEC